MRKRMKSLLSILLAIVMLVSAIPVMGTAADLSAEQLCTVEAERVRELPEFRRTNAETYLLSDGTYECVVHSENIYYEASSGELEPIDNTIVSTDYTENGVRYGFTNAANSIKVYFSACNPTVLIKNGEDELSFSLAGACSGPVCTGDALRARGLENYGFNIATSIVYNDVFQDADLVYSFSNGILRACVLLKSADAPSEYTFNYDLSDYAFVENDNGQTVICDRDGRTVFEFGSAVAVDSVDDYAENVGCERIVRGGDATSVKITIDPQFLSDSEREYPVRASSSIMITGGDVTFDTYVHPGNTAGQHYLETEVRTGKTVQNGDYLTYIKFTIPSYISNGTVLLGKLRIKENSGVTPAVYVRRVTGSWTPSGITWTNKPNATTTDQSTLAWEDLYWYNSYITNIVRSWVYGKSVNYGLQLYDYSGNSAGEWTSLYSSDAASPNKPELHITYTPYKDASLYGLTSNSYDFTSTLDTAKANLESCQINSVFKITGSFTIPGVQLHLDDGRYGLFVIRSFGDVSYSSGVQNGTRVKLNDSSSNPVWFNSASDFNGLDLSNMKLAVFVSSKSGQGGSNGANLPHAAVSHGAKTAIGFSVSLTDYAKANQWIVDLSYYLYLGYNVNGLCSALAGNSYYAGTGVDSPVICGNLYTTFN